MNGRRKRTETKKEEKMRREERGLRSGGDYNIIDKLLCCCSFLFLFHFSFTLFYFIFLGDVVIK